MQMTDLNEIKLDNIDPEDFGDTLLKIEKSFDIKFADNSFRNAKTFGDICDIIVAQVNFTEKNDCTTQQAFYKVRNAIARTQNFDEINVGLQTKLADIFPRSKRRQNIKHFEKELGFSIDILSMKNWLALTIFIGFILSLITFFFSSQIAISGLLFLILFSWTVSKFSKELEISTIGELTEKISRENYSLARRHSGTVNKTEIVKIIQDVFIADHEVDRKNLTREASLGWT